MNIHDLAIGDTIPELTFFIDIPVGIANERRKKKLKGKLSPNDDIKIREKLLKKENKINDLQEDLEKEKKKLNKLLR